MDSISDDEYDRLSDLDGEESDGERVGFPLESAPSSPPSIRNLQASTTKQLACPYERCPKTFDRKARLDEHIRSHQNIRLFKCSQSGCNKDFLRQSHLNHHTKSAHSKIRDHACTWAGCDKSFATGTRLRRHLQAHEGREKFRCRGYGDCDATFRKHETLRKHILSIHEQIQPYQCSEPDNKTGRPCNKAFDTAEKLARHQRSQHDETRFTCSDCMSIYTAMIVNSAPGQSPISVPSDVFFPTYSDLQAHTALVHPPNCQYCPTSFKTAKELTRHLEIQHGVVDPNSSKDQDFHCDHPGCGRAFTKKGNLNVHVKTVHNKKKDFVCGSTAIPLPEELAGQSTTQVFGCGRSFGTRATLMDHVRSAHLNLESKVVQGRKKRKVAAHELDSSTCVSKKRATRKDKGIPRTSALTDLTGLNIHEGFETSQDFINSVYQPFDTQQDHENEEEDDDDEENDFDDFNQLSASMTLVGSNMYHNGKVYHVPSGHYPPGLPIPAGLESGQTGIQTSELECIKQEDLTYDEEDMFAFDEEPQNLDGLVDPLLLQT